MEKKPLQFWGGNPDLDYRINRLKVEGRFRTRTDVLEAALVLLESQIFPLNTSGKALETAKG